MRRLFASGSGRRGIQAYCALVGAGTLPMLCVRTLHGRYEASVYFSGGVRRSVLGYAASESAAIYSRRWHSGSAAADFYKLLGVKPDASMDEIKASYKKLALQYHPDRNSDPGAEEMFKSISEAYHVIGNKARRKEYDMSRSVSSSMGSASGTAYPSEHAYQSPPGYQQMSKEEADRLFRDLFGGVRVDQIFRNVEEEILRSSASGKTSRVSREFSGAEQTFRPFFRSESVRIYTDAHGNHMEEHTYTDPRGTTFTVRTSTSAHPNSSTNQKTEEYYGNKAETSRDGRFHLGNASFKVNPRGATDDFGQAYFGVRTHGRHPMVAIMIVAVWGIVIGTLVLVTFSFLVSHPFFTLLVLFLVLLRRWRFF